jgi:hypothetical protein
MKWKCRASRNRQHLLPFNILQSNGVQVIEPSNRSLNQKVLRADQLRSDVVAHDFDSVAGENAVPDRRVRSREDEYERDDCRACCCGAMDRVHSTGDGPTDQGAKHTAQRGQHHGSASKLVDDIRAPEREPHVPHGQAAIDDRLRSRICDSYPTQYYSQIV